MSSQPLEPEEQAPRQITEPSELLIEQQPLETVTEQAYETDNANQVEEDNQIEPTSEQVEGPAEDGETLHSRFSSAPELGDEQVNLNSSTASQLPQNNYAHSEVAATGQQGRCSCKTAHRQILDRMQQVDQQLHTLTQKTDELVQAQRENALRKQMMDQISQKLKTQVSEMKTSLEDSTASLKKEHEYLRDTQLKELIELNKDGNSILKPLYHQFQIQIKENLLKDLVLKPIG